MKRGFLFYCKIYFKIVSQDIKSKMSYRADFFISTIGMIFTNISGFLTFWIMFQNFPSVMGWTYYEMLFLYGFSLISLTPVQCLFDNNWNLRQYVYSGDFIKYCFRPVNLFFYYMSEIFDLKGLGQLAFGVGTLVFAWNKLQLPISFFIIIKLIIGLFTASLFMIALTNLSAATCFWIVNSGTVMIMINKFRDYAKYPVTIYHPIFKFLFTFVLPIAFIAYYPSLLFLRPDEIPLLSWLSPLFGIAFFLISYAVWMKGANSYDGTGS